MQRDINITIKLEEIAPFSVKVPIDAEPEAREAERIVNLLYNSWKGKFASFSPVELMGRIAFHVARNYEELRTQLKSAEELLQEGEKELDRFLLDME